ncbi:Crp/Fnr family transcriptional regulator, partial [Longimicrobium sp.]|uniref:Crp/Fnr family transcriptional regulator n=1 Tax=Longimicrobium sp. TaxID=2029185 RepID=UPI002E2F1974
MFTEEPTQRTLDPDGDTPRNRILAALPPDEWERVRASLERVPLPFRTVLFEPNQAIAYVYFPEDAVVSILGIMEDGSAVETGTVGNEGMVGVPVFLGAMQMAGQAFAQVSGTAWRMPAGALREETRRGSTLARLLGRYTQALFTLVAQSSACNRKHGTEQRCARWLLMTHDRVGGDTFELTQLFLSQMLGVRRATVNETATALQARGLIRYVRGRVTIMDRAGLEAAACPCYDVIRAEFARMLEDAVPPSLLDDVRVSEAGMSTAGDGAPLDGGAD